MGAALFASTAAMAQNPPAQSGPNNNAVNSSGQNNSNAPVAGRNSFTDGQAKSAIEKAGYNNVSDLKKDDNGVWRGKASKGGRPPELAWTLKVTSSRPSNNTVEKELENDCNDFQII